MQADGEDEREAEMSQIGGRIPEEYDLRAENERLRGEVEYLVDTHRANTDVIQRLDVERTTFGSLLCEWAGPARDQFPDLIGRTERALKGWRR